MSATPMLRSLSAPVARPHSPSPKKLSARDTPFGLFDPHGRHSLAPSVGVSSTLTIVRMPYAAGELKEVACNGGRSGRRQQTQMHARSHSSSSLLRSTSSSPSSHTGRLSFASNSVLHTSQNPTRPSLSSHARSVSTPVSGLRQARNQAQSPQRLSPPQIYSSAKDARAPWTGTPSNGVGDTVSKSFTPLPADIILPFASRALEVSELFQHGANARLLTILSHVFLAGLDDAASSSTSEISSSSASSAPLGSKLPEDWNFADLRFWLFEVDRADVGDALWVRTLRRAVLTHSEVLWERVKAVLGAPFDLDAVSGSSPISRSSLVEGRSALSLNLIHPVPKSVGEALEEIAEDEGEGAANDRVDNRDAIVGLRFSTPRTHPVLSTPTPPTSKRSLSPSRSPRLPLRSISQNSVPTISSPLAERHFECRVNDARTILNSHQSGVRTKKSDRASPLFPGSFSGLGLALRAPDSVS